MFRGEREEIRLLREILHELRKISHKILIPGPVTAKLGVTDMATTATLTFVDDTGADAPPPTGDGSGITVTFSSDNPDVTVGSATASGDTATATITGTEAFNLSAVVANSSGVPLVDDDGTTAFVQPSPIAVPASTPPTPQSVTAILTTD